MLGTETESLISHTQKFTVRTCQTSQGGSNLRNYEHEKTLASNEKPQDLTVVRPCYYYYYYYYYYYIRSQCFDFRSF